MNLADRIRTRGAPQRSITSVDDFIAAVAGSFYGQPFTQTLGGGQTVQAAPDTFRGHAARFAGNGVVFACMEARLSVFSGARFAFQRLNNGRPSEMFGTPALQLLERPWPGGTTQDLLARVLLDADLAGNSYWVRQPDGLARLAPDHVDVMIARRPSGLGWRKLGYAYWPDGQRGDAGQMVPLSLDEVAHFAPIPDPVAEWRGMSWLTPVVREVQGDDLMSEHKRAFFSNGATPNMVVRHLPTTTRDKILEFARLFEAEYQGVENAYRAMHLGGGADVTVVGKDMQQLEFKLTQAAGETRIAAASGVPAIIVGLSEGLASGTFSNYTQARRRFADGTLHPLWGNAAGSLEQIVRAPDPGSRLWYDARDIPFLRDDSKEAAEIQQMQAATMRSLVDAGYTPESVRRAVMSGDFALLEHSGLFSVQLQQPGSNPTPAQEAQP